MDNSNLPSDGDPQDHERTQEFGPAGVPPLLRGPAGARGSGGDPGQAWNQPTSPGQAWNQSTIPPAQAWNQSPGTRGPAGRASAPYMPRQRRRRGLWWGVGLVVVALLVGGGAFAVTKLAASNVPAGPTGQAAQLNTMLSNASSPASVAASNSFAQTAAGRTGSTAVAGRCAARVARLRASGHPVAAARALLLCRNPLLRLRLIGGLHGTFTFKTKSGITTIAYERGVIQSVSGGNVVVKAEDGTTWTWVLQSNSVIHQGGKKVSSSALSDGQQLFVAGTVVNSNYQARLLVVRASSASPSPAS